MRRTGPFLFMVGIWLAQDARLAEPSPAADVEVTAIQTAVALSDDLAARRTTERVERADVGLAWGTVPGVLQFRGNPTHTWYGQGPVPEQPKILWRFPRGEPMCAWSWVGDEGKEWCGLGWTGQPVVWERPDGVTELIFGAYDRRVHFLDAKNGRRTRTDLVAQDLVKGSVTLDPDGFPLLYYGARDNRLRIAALDRRRPRVLWQLRAGEYPGIYTDDWDANPSVVGGMLYEAGENGHLFAIALNRGYDAGGRVRVAPEVKVAFPAWDDELVARIGDRNTSIESSPAVFEDRLYAATSAGRIVGLDISRVEEGIAPVVFDYWVGDDADASIVIDEEGMLYVAVELERHLPRALEVGQLVKLDPYRAGDPRVWGVPIPDVEGDKHGGGMWATPALGRGVLYAPTQAGDLLVVDRQTGEVVWSQNLDGKLWSSPLLVDDTLLVGACKRGRLFAYSVVEPRTPELLWRFELGPNRCIESTPVIWKGRIYFGARDGYFYALGDR